MEPRSNRQPATSKQHRAGAQCARPLSTLTPRPGSRASPAHLAAGEAVTHDLQQRISLSLLCAAPRAAAWAESGRAPTLAVGLLSLQPSSTLPLLRSRWATQRECRYDSACKGSARCDSASRRQPAEGVALAAKAQLLPLLGTAAAVLQCTVHGNQAAPWRCPGRTPHGPAARPAGRFACRWRRCRRGRGWGCRAQRWPACKTSSATRALSGKLEEKGEEPSSGSHLRLTPATCPPRTPSRWPEGWPPLLAAPAEAPTQPAAAAWPGAAASPAGRPPRQQRQRALLGWGRTAWAQPLGHRQRGHPHSMRSVRAAAPWRPLLLQPAARARQAPRRRGDQRRQLRQGERGPALSGSGAPPVGGRCRGEG